jgi:hypothetical protein
VSQEQINDTRCRRHIQHLHRIVYTFVEMNSLIALQEQFSY